MVGQTTEAVREGFRLGLRDHGYVEGKNILVEWRTAEAQTNRENSLALELVSLKVDVIVATQTQAILAAKNASSTIPIVMAPAADPVATGFVASLARPGGNITGLTNIAAELFPKLLELMRALRPAMKRVAVLLDATNSSTRSFLEQIQPAADSIGIRMQPVFVRRPEEFDGAFAAMVKERAGAVIIQPPVATKRAADLALKHRLLSATTGLAGTFPELGGLMFYGSSLPNTYRQAAGYVDKILKGAKPADLPVERPTVFELVINRKTAKALGITIPQSMLLRADRVIE
jgi:putative ABC transport system substrate-binding protein